MSNESPERTLFVSQSNYIPWRGYFSAIRRADVFVIYDTVQYTKGDWRNRNRVLTRQGPKWLTIPVLTKGLHGQAINEVRVNGAWADKHLKTIEQEYSKAPYFDELHDWIASLYDQVAPLERLTEINERMIRAVCEWLEIGTEIRRSEEYELRGDRNDRLLQLCEAESATTYLSGPAAKSYLANQRFEESGTEVEWMDYSHLTPYQQCHDGFEPAVSVIDLMMCAGSAAPEHL